MVVVRGQEAMVNLISLVSINLKPFNSMNTGKARLGFEPKQNSRGIKIHRSVKFRMEAQRRGKKDKYRLKPGICDEPRWID